MAPRPEQTPSPGVRALRATLLAATAAIGIACCDDPAAGSAELATSALMPAGAFAVIAHRGASAYAPENTLPAFRRAVELGARDVELDVQLSRDDVVVLFHDRTLDDKTDRSGRVRDHPASVLRATEIGRWFDRAHPRSDRKFAGTTLVTLGELFAELGARVHYHVELKGREAGLPGRVLAEIRRHGLESGATLTSFQLEQLERVRLADAAIPTCLLVKSDLEPAIARAVDAGIGALGIRARELTPAGVRRAHAAGLELRAWDVRSEEDLERAVASGASGATVDWPDRALARLRELGGSPR